MTTELINSMSQTTTTVRQLVIESQCVSFFKAIISFQLAEAVLNCEHIKFMLPTLSLSTIVQNTNKRKLLLKYIVSSFFMIYSTLETL